MAADHSFGGFWELNPFSVGLPPLFGFILLEHALAETGHKTLVSAWEQRCMKTNSRVENRETGNSNRFNIIQRRKKSDLQRIKDKQIMIKRIRKLRVGKMM